MAYLVIELNVTDQTIQDLNDKEDPTLRVIQQKGEFKNLETYLDSNFRLLREDFMRDLREGFQLV